jgi:hypothetical protein
MFSGLDAPSVRLYFTEKGTRRDCHHFIIQLRGCRLGCHKEIITARIFKTGGNSIKGLLGNPDRFFL